jgi:hypothetical protein
MSMMMDRSRRAKYSEHTDNCDALLATPLAAVPTCLFVTRNVELPMDADELGFFAGDIVDFFTLLDNRQTPRISASRALQPKTFTPSIPFIMLGICFYGYHEPVQIAVDGNNYGPQANHLLASTLPASPMMPINTALRLAAYGLDHLTADDFFAFRAQYEWGGPTLRAIYAYMRSYRLQLLCPDNNFSIVLDELLADIGNCCAMDTFQGWGNTEAAWAYFVQRTNIKLAENQNVDLGDPGFFYPINCADDGETLTPYRTPNRPASYGQEEQSGQVVPWQRLPFPLPLEPNDQIYIQLVRENGDAFYRTRFMEEVTFKKGINPNPNFTSGKYNGVGITDQTFSSSNGPIMECTSQIPGGQMRFGIGMKGFEVARSVSTMMKTKLTCGPASIHPVNGEENMLGQHTGSAAALAAERAASIGQLGAIHPSLMPAGQMSGGGLFASIEKV